MKAILVGALAAIVLATAAGFVLEGYLSRGAERAFAAPTARVGAGEAPDGRRE